MIDPSKISEPERSLVVEFANQMRDLDTIALLAKPTTRLSKSAKHKLWDRVQKQIDKPMTESFQALVQLQKSANSELREIAVKAINKDSAAIEELRRLANRIKQL